jgi:hypothetical protein
MLTQTIVARVNKLAGLVDGFSQRLGAVQRGARPLAESFWPKSPPPNVQINFDDPRPPPRYGKRTVEIF